MKTPLFPNGLRAAVTVLTLAGLLTTTGHTQTKRILDKRVDSFQTGLQDGRFFDYWVDDNQFVMTTPQEGAPETFWANDSLTRIALINIATKTVKFIAQGPRVLSYDRDTRVLLIGNTHRTNLPDPRNGPAAKKTGYSDLREIRIEPNGDVVDIRRLERGSEPPDFSADWPGDKLFQPLDHGRNGYLLKDLAPGDTDAKQEERLIKSDEGYPTTWIRPGKPPLPIPVRFDEIDTGIYVDFLDKYLLNASGVSSDNKNEHKVWHRPYEYVPFHLLGKDGSIEEIPYPEFVFDYGIATRDLYKQIGQNFTAFMLTRAGIIIQKIREYDSALYLFENNQLYRITGGKKILGINVSPLSTEGIWTMALSPDGCKIAYTHLNIPLSQLRGDSPRYLSIINVCKESK